MFEHFDYKPMLTPYDSGSQLKKNKEHSIAQIKYAQIIENLIYLTNCTKSDITYAVSRLNQYTNVLIRTIRLLFVEYLSI